MIRFPQQQNMRMPLALFVQYVSPLNEHRAEPWIDSFLYEKSFFL